MSAQRPFLAPNTFTPIVNAVSTATQIISPVTIIQMLPGISYDISWSGTTTGTIAVQVSNTYVPNAEGGAQANTTPNWTTLPAAGFSGTYPVPAGTPGSGFLDVVGTEAYAVRLVFTPSAGTGTMTVVACAKVL